MSIRSVISGLCIVLCLTWSSSIPGQPNDITLSQKQEELNQQAFAAAVDGDFARAERLLEASLSLGEANFTYLNLGRALAHQGRCKEAVEAYDAVATAPQISEPSPEKIEEVLNRFRADLPEQCPGEVVIECKPATIMVQIDQDEPRTCPMSAVELPAGRHTVVGRLNDEAVSRTVDVEGLERSAITLIIEQDSAVHQEIPALSDDSQNADGYEILGWILTGLGVATLTSGVVFTEVVLPNDIAAYRNAAESGNRERYRDLGGQIETRQNLTIGLLASGSVLLTSGLGLLIWRFVDSSESPASTTQPISAWTTNHSSGLLWRTNW